MQHLAIRWHVQLRFDTGPLCRKRERGAGRADSATLRTQATPAVCA
ncbi:hypothetical protein P3W85_36170 [Cupriavidus basilensis]|uniref:Uncharacterized protein n=1 Tax=Cupriavidus basilensis TaxID=68895 RepID=A0ABT6B0B6_9BURK|nr:hypothetical protein [Cupriavidus basilensis]MDF3838327.1 hypothetical protein [Cupriavidus basilensis]